MLGILYILIIFFLYVCFAVLFSRSPEGEENYTAQRVIEASKREKKSGVVYVDDRGHISFTRPPEGRCLDGRPLATEDDWTQWYVWKGYAEGLSRRLTDLEIQIEQMENPNSLGDLLEWRKHYDQVRQLFIRHGMWNYEIGDDEPFIPTPAQRVKEQELLTSIAQKQQNALPMQIAYAKYSSSMLEYIKKQPHHVALRSSMINAVSDNNQDTKSIVWKVYRRMRVLGIVKERHNEDGRWEVKRAPARRKRPKQEEARVSQYSPSLYSLVTRRTEYKVLITVGEPMDLSRQENHCHFVSKSSGEVYSTYLDQCTCPMFSPGREPCKHMVALAAKLGYYHISVQASKPH